MKNREIPLNSVFFSRLKESKHPIKRNIEPSSHTVTLQELDNDLFFYKLNNRKNNSYNSNHKGSEYEAAVGALYRVLINDRAPRIKSVVDEQGQRKGVISDPIEGYISLLKASIRQQYSNIHKRSNLSKDILLKGEIARVLVAAYVFEENDLHLGNLGFRKDGKIAKIDHDQSLWSLTQKYVSQEKTGIKAENHYKIPIVAEDIRTFPVLKHAKPRRWVIVMMRTEALEKINLDEEFNREKYTYFLKSILMSPELIHNIAITNFTSLAACAKFSHFMITRLIKLEEELLKIPEFIEFLRENPQIGEELISQFDESEHAYIREKLTSLYNAVFTPESKNNEKITPTYENLFTPPNSQEENTVTATEYLRIRDLGSKPTIAS